MNDLKPTITERRRQTRNRMYRFIYESDVPVNKHQLAAEMGYSLPTVHQNIAELLDAGFIRPGEVQKSTGGRPAVGYVVNGNVKYAVGISVSSTQIRMLVLNICMEELAYTEILTDAGSSDEIGDRIAQELETFLEQHGIDRKKILGVGITFPGVIDSKRDRIVLSPTLRMKNLSLARVREAIPYPLFIENDSTSGASAEWRGLSEPERAGDAVFLFLENGIGGAVFIDGRPFSGQERRSGEFGHMCIVPDGRRCSCGKRGCLEAYTSAMRITGDLGIGAEEFFEGLLSGNTAYAERWEELLGYLAVGINNLRMAFNTRVILGGLISGYLEPYLPELRRKAAEKNTFDESGDYISLGKYPTKAGMMGVAWYFAERFIREI